MLASWWFVLCWWITEWDILLLPVSPKIDPHWKCNRNSLKIRTLLNELHTIILHRRGIMTFLIVILLFLEEWRRNYNYSLHYMWSISIDRLLSHLIPVKPISPLPLLLGFRDEQNTHALCDYSHTIIRLCWYILYIVLDMVINYHTNNNS